MNQTQEIILLQPQISLQRDKSGKTYFLIRDQDTNQTYFAFFGQVKKGWSDLTTKFLKAKVVLIKSVEQKKVINLSVLTKRELRKDKYAYLFKNPILFKILYS
jgi:hypothetical protein